MSQREEVSDRVSRRGRANKLNGIEKEVLGKFEIRIRGA